MTEFMRKPAANQRKEIEIPGSTNKVVYTNYGDFIINSEGVSIGRFEKIYPFQNGVAKVETSEGHAIINTNGEFVTKIYSNTVIDGDIIRFKHRGKWGLKNLNGKVIVSAKFDFIERFNESGLARVNLLVDGKVRWGVINKKGHYEIEPIYWDIFELGEQIAAKKCGAYGVIDKKGKVIQPFVYRHIAKKAEGTLLWQGLHGEEPVLLK